jgi:hypothetical protein
MSRTAQRIKKKGGGEEKNIPDDELAKKSGEGVGQDVF